MSPSKDEVLPIRDSNDVVRVRQAVRIQAVAGGFGAGRADQNRDRRE